LGKKGKIKRGGGNNFYYGKGRTPEKKKTPKAEKLKELNLPRTWPFIRREQRKRKRRKKKLKCRKERKKNEYKRVQGSKKKDSRDWHHGGVSQLHKVILRD